MDSNRRSPAEFGNFDVSSQTEQTADNTRNLRGESRERVLVAVKVTFRGDDLTTPATPDTSQAPQHGFPGSHPLNRSWRATDSNPRSPVKKNPLVETVLSTFPALPLPKGTEEGVWPSPNLAARRIGALAERCAWMAATLKEGADQGDDTCRDFALVARDLVGEPPLPR
jgi:hypothetical protein